MFCTKCKGVQIVNKVHEEKGGTKSRLCDVVCLSCVHIVYFQPYDFGSKINLVTNDKKLK